MSADRRLFCGAVLTLITLSMFADGSSALAQTPWRRNMYDRYNHFRSQRSMRHARDYSSDLHNYSRDVKKIEPQVAKSESTKLGENIATAQHNLDALRKSAAGDAETLAALDAVQEHLKRAAKTHTALHAECSKDVVDGGVCTHCCNEITKELEKAMAEHSALMRKLDMREQKEATPPKDP